MCPHKCVILRHKSGFIPTKLYTKQLFPPHERQRTARNAQSTFPQRAGVPPSCGSHFVAAKIHISNEQFVEIGDAFGHDEILRILVEEIVAAHRGECEQSEAERKDILFHESWQLESDAQPEGVGRAERKGGLDREAILGGILPFEFRRFDGEEIRHREIEREVGERHFLQLSL